MTSRKRFWGPKGGITINIVIYSQYEYSASPNIKVETSVDGDTGLPRKILRRVLDQGPFAVISSSVSPMRLLLSLLTKEPHEAGRARTTEWD